MTSDLPVDPSDIEAIFWDIGGVIVDTDSIRRSHRQFLERIVRDQELTLTVDEAIERWRTAVGEYFRARDGTEYRRAKDAYAHGIRAVVNGTAEPDGWLDDFQDIMIDHIRPMPHATSTIAKIAQTDRHLGIISDIDADEASLILSTLDVEGYFDSITTSEAVGRTKPDPKMFEAALEVAAADPTASAMIGDRYRHDMEGAKAFGMFTVGYGTEDGPAVDRLISDLRELVEMFSDP